MASHSILETLHSQKRNFQLTSFSDGALTATEFADGHAASAQFWAGQLNRHLLTRVRDHILRCPEQFDLEDFWTPAGRFDIIGTTLKLAGFDVAAVNDAPALAQTILGLSDEQADSLFMSWPERFRRRYTPEPVTAAEFKRNAKAAAARIDHLLLTGC